MGTYSGVADVLERMEDVAEFCNGPLHDVNQRGIGGSTPLYVAAVWGDLEAARLLIEAGADVNAHNEDGETALHWAASEGDRALAILLIERGASLTELSDEAETPRQLAVLLGHSDLLDILG
jgi:ankyrin repeat protein